MTGTLKIDFSERKIIMDRLFAKLATDTNSPEYRHLQEVRQDYSDFTVVQRHIGKNPKKKTYAGLTYDYMESYILAHGTNEIAREYYRMREIAECQGKAFRYPVIKSWFLDKFPEIVQFGVIEDAEIASPVKVLPAKTDIEAEKETNVESEKDIA